MTLDELVEAQHLLSRRETLLHEKSRLIADYFLEIRYNPKTGETRVDFPHMWGSPIDLRQTAEQDIKPMCEALMLQIEQAMLDETEALKARIEALGVVFDAGGQGDENQN